MSWSSEPCRQTRLANVNGPTVRSTWGTSRRRAMGRENTGGGRAVHHGARNVRRCASTPSRTAGAARLPELVVEVHAVAAGVDQHLPRPARGQQRRGGLVGGVLAQVRVEAGAVLGVVADEHDVEQAVAHRRPGASSNPGPIWRMFITSTSRYAPGQVLHRPTRPASARARAVDEHLAQLRRVPVEAPRRGSDGRRCRSAWP